MNLEQVARRPRSPPPPCRGCSTCDIVKGSTRARVVKAIDELKYHPNLHARVLAGGKSRTNRRDRLQPGEPFFFDIYKAVEAGAHAALRGGDGQHRLPVRATRGQHPADDRAARGGLAAIVSEMEPR